MKKFYSILALAAAVTLSASAERHQANLSVLPVKSVDVVTPSRTLAPGLKAKAPFAKAAEAKDIEALNVWGFYSLITDQTTGEAQGEGANYVSVSVSANNEVSVILGELEDFAIKGTFDPATGTLSLKNNQKVGEDVDGPIYFYVKVLNAAGTAYENSKAATVDAVYTDGAVTFPANDIWALGDPDHENIGFYALTAQNVFIEYVDPFTTVDAQGKFVENMLYPLFNAKNVGTETNPQYESIRNTTASTVEVQSDGEGTYRVLNPLQALYASVEVDGESPSFDIDTTDPDNCLIAMTSSGLGSQTAGTYAYFSESWYAAEYGDQEEDYVWDPSLAITKKVDGDNVTITIPYHAITVFATTAQKFYYGSEFPSTLTFKDANAGIKGVAVDNADAPAVYYNLQGVRIENPTSGVVIRVQGGKATKMLVK